MAEVWGSRLQLSDGSWGALIRGSVNVRPGDIVITSGNLVTSRDICVARVIRVGPKTCLVSTTSQKLFHQKSCAKANGSATGKYVPSRKKRTIVLHSASL